MNLPAVIDVALGLIVLYLLLSTLCSFAVELLATVFWWRKNLLYKTIARLLTGSSECKVPTKGILPRLERLHPNEVLNRFWNHRLIVALAPARELPSYIEPSTFAAAVIDLAVPGADTGALPSTSEALDKVIRRAAVTADAAADQVPADGLSPQALRPLREAVLSAFRACGSNRPMIQTVPPIEDLRRSLEKWYNEAMDRSSGQYKRRARRWLLAMGVIAAFAFNADTIRTTYVLSTNDSLRNTAAAYAATLTTVTTSTNAIAQDARVFDLAVTNEIAVAQLRTNLVADLRELQKLQQLGFPLGWKGGKDLSLNFEPFNNLNPLLIFLLKLTGLLATALAISLGAPFWFDLLNKLASLRGSGNRVATEPDTSKTKSATESRTSAATQSSKAEATATPVTTETAATPDPKTLLTDLADGRLGFDARKAYWSAEAALLAYAEKGPVTAAFKLWGLEVPHYFDTVPACQGFLAVSSEKKIAVLAFRGTEKNLEDWRTDAEFALTAKPCIFDGTETHAGFCGEFDKAYPELKEKIAEYVKDDMLLYVTGHSLGAALATLAAARLTVDKVRGVHAVYTFGSPRVGNPAFAKAYDYVLGPRTHRCVNAEDLVTRVPPRIIPGKDWKYDHVGQVVYFDSDGRMHLGVGFWQRFLNTVINAIEDFRKELQTLLKDHSMEGYVRLLKRQINGR